MKLLDITFKGWLNLWRSLFYAAGALGDWIVLTERGDWNGETYPIKEVKAFKVDGEKIKADTFYKLVDGEAVEVK